MPDIVLDYHRLKTPIDHPDKSVAGEKLGIDIASLVYIWTTFPSIWGFPSATRKVVLGKLIDLWGAGIDTEDKFWRKFYCVSDEGNFRRLLNKIDDVISVVGRPHNYLSSMAYGLAIRLLYFTSCSIEGAYLTDYVLSDIDIYWYVIGTKGWVMERSQSNADLNNVYLFDFDTLASAADFKIHKVVAGTITTLASEAVDLSSTTYYSLRATLVGSVLSFYRGGVLRLQATDTTFVSGIMGISRHDVNLYWMRLYRKAYETAKGTLTPQAIIEVKVEGSGSMSPEDPYRPKLKSDLRSIDSLTGLPEYLYKQKDIQQQVDLDAVTWGAFEFSWKSPTNIIMVYGDNPYKDGAIRRQVEHAESKNLRVFAPPKDYREAVSLYNKLKRDFKHWLAGKDNFAYMVLGLEELYWMQNVDFYYGELIEHKTHYQQLKQVPDWEIRSRLNELIERLSKITVLTDERDKHINKAKEILKKGW